jgi:multiple sugar transport system permease protein
VSPRLAKAIVNGLLVGLAAVSLVPLLWMLSVAFMQPGEASHFPPRLLPAAATLHNFRELFLRAGMGRYLFNSFLIASATTLIALLLNTMAGYAFAKLQFGGRERVFRVLLAALVIPVQVTMMPLFLMLKQVGLVNSYAGAIIPGMAGVFGIFLVRQYARSIPDELLEAARIDGAGEFRIFFQIILPVLKPILVTLAIFVFLASWNDFMWPLIVITSQDQMTIPLGLSYFQGAHFVRWPLLMAANVMSLLPMLLVFIGAQRYFVQSVASTGLKG